MSTEVIVIIDTGVANTASVKNMLKKLGADAICSSDPQLSSHVGKLVIPGVGSFDTAMHAIRTQGIDQAVYRAVRDHDSYLLGICLGMQMLFERSEEGLEPGLSLIPGNIVKFDRSRLDNKQRVPNMGWRYIAPVEITSLFDGSDNSSKFYFVHSFHAPIDTLYAGAYSIHGYRFPCAVSRQKILGVQFHREKSHKYGMKLLKKYMEL